MLKVFIGSVLGLTLYASLSLYQPLTDVRASSQAQASQSRFSFESPIPYDLVVGNK